MCDDEMNARALIVDLIREQEKDACIEEFQDGGELEEEDVLQYDILFLDVSMKMESGVETVRYIRRKQQEAKEEIWGSFPLIIFITGYSEYMAEAISLHAFGYLVKPLKRKEFEQCFQRAVEECRKRREKGRRKSLTVKIGSMARTIPQEEIRYVESQKRKNIIHLAQEQIICYGLIGDLEQELKPGFFRIHKGYLVNMRYVEKYSRTQVWMQDGDCLMLSKYRYGEFVAAYLRYLKE